MDRLIKQFLFSVLASAVVAASFAATIHTHALNSESSIYSTGCSCTLPHDGHSESDSDGLPEGSDDCQLCKFLAGFGCLQMASVTGHQTKQIETVIATPGVGFAQAAPAFYQGRAPPAV